MTVYLDVLMLLNFLVDYALLLGTNRLAGFPPGWGRCALAAGAGSLYGGICMLPGFRFLGNPLWRLAALALMSGIAFGWDAGMLRRGVLFTLLSMALGGVALGLGSRNFGSLAAAALAVAGMCVLGFPNTPGSRRFVPAELCLDGKKLHITALVDTGNTLKDPITGQQVLVVGADVGEKLGIRREAILDPITALEQQKTPRLRLIPYRAVGQPGGMLLAMRMDSVYLGGREASPMVAFAPNEIDRANMYQALAGGMV